VAHLQKIGLDFDNTLICYDQVFVTAAIERGLVQKDFAGIKRQVRDTIRLLPDGERRWMELQGHVYGAGIGGARPFPGVGDFLRRARQAKAEIVIVSHKTQYGHFDAERVDLREAALGWMRAEQFFVSDHGGLCEKNVHFADSRADKLKLIAGLAFDVFIDDLYEVLTDHDFPPEVERILFSADGGIDEEAPFVVLSDWPSIKEHIFDDHSNP
jgi:hypothetical protein